MKTERNFKSAFSHTFLPRPEGEGRGEGVQLKPAFSLMEMMVVLLIISIIAAVSAPMVTRKLSRDAQTSDNPWSYTNLTGNIAYNMNGSDRVSSIIGAVLPPEIRQTVNWNVGNGLDQERFSHYLAPKLYIANTASGAMTEQSPAIAFGNRESRRYYGHITLDSDGNVIIGKAYPAFNPNAGTGTNDSVIIGTRAHSRVDANRPNSNGNVIIGRDARAFGENSVVIGNGAGSQFGRSIIIGSDAVSMSNQSSFTATQKSSIVIGANAKSMAGISIGDSYDSNPGSTFTESGCNSIAIGRNASAMALSLDQRGAIAIGNDSMASALRSIAIGHDTKVTGSGTIAIRSNPADSSVKFHTNPAYETTSGSQSVVIGYRIGNVGSLSVVAGSGINAGTGAAARTVPGNSVVLGSNHNVSGGSTDIVVGGSNSLQNVSNCIAIGYGLSVSNSGNSSTNSNEVLIGNGNNKFNVMSGGAVHAADKRFFVTNNGDIYLYNKKTNGTIENTFYASAPYGSIYAAKNRFIVDSSGNISLRNADQEHRLYLDSSNGSIYAAYDDSSGYKFYVSSDGSVVTKGNVTVGGTLSIKDLTVENLRVTNSLKTDKYQAWDYWEDISMKLKGVGSQPSDRRLKNVGVKFKGGLEELKKLDLYHFTYKKDDSKTPHVGVIAQDLQKVFPDAVTADNDGYLMIRWEDMFYALINAVKELDNKIASVVEKVQANFDEITKLKATIAEQQKEIKELRAQNADFEKRLAKLEKKSVKAEKKAAKAEEKSAVTEE